MNKQNLDRFKTQLAAKLAEACENGVQVIKDVTPIDTQRLYASTRVGEPSVEGNKIKCKIIVGGISLYGIRREQELVKDVNYAIFVERKYQYIRKQESVLISEILKGLINGRARII